MSCTGSLASPSSACTITSSSPTNMLALVMLVRLVGVHGLQQGEHEAPHAAAPAKTATQKNVSSDNRANLPSLVTN